MLDFDFTLVVVVAAVACITAIGIFAFFHPSED
jgi:hypothetical protein